MFQQCFREDITIMLHILMSPLAIITLDLILIFILYFQKSQLQQLRRTDMKYLKEVLWLEFVAVITLQVTMVITLSVSYRLITPESCPFLFTNTSIQMQSLPVAQFSRIL